MLLFSAITSLAVAVFIATLLLLFFMGQHLSEKLKCFEIMLLFLSEVSPVEI
jgi:hypothetical protein